MAEPGDRRQATGDSRDRDRDRDTDGVLPPAPCPLPPGAEQEQPRCLVCGQPAGPGSGGSVLAAFRGETLDLVGHLCAACRERLEREREEAGHGQRAEHGR